MRQLLHIFKKDIRGLAGELAVFLGSLFLACMSFPYESAQAGPLELEGTGVAELLVLLAGCYLISRLIHAETIPGSVHFWLTRPYRWPSLLGAKALFVLVWGHLPVFVVQAVLLWFEGFPVLGNLAGLLWTQFLIFACVSLPAAGIAAVTRGLAGFALFVAGGLASGVSLFFLLDRPRARFNVLVFEAESNGFEWIAYAILAVALTAAALPALYAQYSARKTSLSSALLVGSFWTGLVLSLSSRSNLAATEGSRMATVQRVPNLTWAIQALASSRSLDTASLEFSLGTPTFMAAMSERGLIAGWPPTSFEGTHIEIDLPLAISGVAPGIEIRTDPAAVFRSAPNGGGFVARGSALRTGHVILSIEGADGEAYPVQAIVFQASQMDVMFGNEHQLPLILHIADGKVYEKLRNKPLTVRGYIDLVFVGNVGSLSVPRTAFPVNVTNAFRCGLETLRPGKPEGLSCRVAFRWPQQSIDVGGALFVKSESFSPFPANLRLNPILYRYPTSALPESEQVEFTIREPVSYVRKEFEIHNVRLIEGPGTRTGWGPRR